MNIIVCDPIVKDGVKNYILYTVKGTDKHGNFEVLRRYNDFLQCRQSLLTNWPGIYIAPLPPKKAVGNLELKFIEERQRDLNHFVKSISENDILWESDDFSIFIRSLDMKKDYEFLQPLSPQQLLQRYIQTYPEIVGLELNYNIIAKINSFFNFAKKAESIITNCKDISFNLTDIKNKGIEQMKLELEYLLPEYEKQSQITKIGNPKFQFTNSNELIYELLRIETNELAAFVEIYNQKQKYDLQRQNSFIQLKKAEEDYLKLKNGKIVIANLLNMESKEKQIEKYEKKFEEYKKIYEIDEQLCDFLNRLLGHKEIDKFKRRKQEVYYSTLKKLCESEIQEAKQTQQFWNEFL